MGDVLGLPNRGSTALAAGTLTWPAPDLGFRAITAVRVWTDGDANRYEVDGVRHRRPVTVAVSEALAARFVAAGIPLVRRTAAPAVDADRLEVASC
jgi:hypothetical protein